jgi:hypothetical protein
MTTATHTAIYAHRLAFDGHATVSTLEQRSQAPKKEVSTLKFQSEAAHIIRSAVRSGDLVQVKGSTVTVVIPASQAQAKTAVKRLNQACAIAGYGIPTLLEIRTSSF